MVMRKLSYISWILMSVIAVPGSLKADAEQLVGSRELAAQQDSQVVDTMQERVEETDPVLVMDENLPADNEQEMMDASPAVAQDAPASDLGPKVLINKIVVNGVESVNYEKILDIVLPYEGQDLSLVQMNAIASEVTDFYSKRGYVTSYAYLPEQDVSSGQLEILVVEGKVGQVIVVGNERFGENIFTVDIVRRMQGKILNYRVLKSIIRELNNHPDRNVSASLKAGEAKGTTDIVVQVEEESLLSTTIGYNNMGTKMTDRDRYTLGLRKSNFLGLDEQWILNSTYGEGVVAVSGMYLVPVMDHRTKFGVSSGFSKIDIKGTHNQFGIESKAKTNMAFLQHQVYGGDEMDVTGRLGLRVADVQTRSNNHERSSDDITAAFTGFDFVYRGTKETAVVSVGADFGIPDFLGSNPKENPQFSRTPAQAGFEKYSTSLDYYYKLPWDYTFLRTKGYVQYTPDDLASAEQMSLTGFNAVRGYEEGSYRADTGGVASVEVYTPFPLFKECRLPFSDKAMKETVQLLGFFDYGIGHINTVDLNEVAKDEFRSVGVGLRVRLYKNMFARFEVGFPINDPDRDFEDSKFHVAIQTELF